MRSAGFVLPFRSVTRSRSNAGGAREASVVRIMRITPGDPLYPQELALREQVLLRPLGLDINRFRELFPGYEDRFEHFVAVFDHPMGQRVIGCALLLADHPERGMGKLMQMAIDPQRQGEGLGRRLVVEVECRAFGELGLRALFCHAQRGAKGFYEKLGWAKDGEEFSEAGIPHLKMSLVAPDEEEEVA